MEWRCDIVPEMSKLNIVSGGIDSFLFPTFCKVRVLKNTTGCMLWALVSRHNASCFFKLHDGLSMLTTKYRSCLIAVTSKGELLHMLRYFDTYLRFACMWKVDHCWAWPYMAVDPPAATGNYTVSGGALGWALSPARVSSLLHHRWHQDPEGNLVDRARVRVIAVKGPLSAAYFHDSYFQLGGCDDPPQWQSACECLYSHAACCL